MPSDNNNGPKSQLSKAAVLHLEEEETIQAKDLGAIESWKKIGHGGYADVFLGEYCSCPVAIKKYHQDVVDIESPEFKKEVRALR